MAEKRASLENRELFQAWLNGDAKRLYEQVKYIVGRENRLKLTDRQVLEYFFCALDPEILKKDGIDLEDYPEYSKIREKIKGIREKWPKD